MITPPHCFEEHTSWQEKFAWDLLAQTCVRHGPPSRTSQRLHAGVRCPADDRRGIEQLARYITRPAISNERLSINRDGNAVLKLKTPWRNGVTHIAKKWGQTRINLNPWCNYLFLLKNYYFPLPSISRGRPLGSGAARRPVSDSIFSRKRLSPNAQPLCVAARMVSRSSLLSCVRNS